jgi:YD repeat-containing protein
MSAGRLITVALALALVVGDRSDAANPHIDARGFQPNRDLLSELPFEHIDPMTGNVLLTFTDLVLPGNAGFDLRIQRTYNSKIYDLYTNAGGFTLDEDSWAGIGWRLHMGRVLTSISPGVHPIIEMPDGSRHQLYPHMDRVGSHYMSKDYWTFEIGLPDPILRLPNGVRYTFGHGTWGSFLYVTQIEDAFGNEIIVNYESPPAPLDAIASITQKLVGQQQTRTVTFRYNENLPGPLGDQATGNLASMTFNGNTWTYTQRLTNIFAYTQLVAVEPPVGPSWTFDYDDSNPTTLYMLDHLETPNGGEIDYAYVPQIFYIGSGSLFSPALIRRETSGRDVMPGVWTYKYSSSQDANQTIVTSDSDGSGCDVEITYTFLGLGPNANQDAWAIGALDKKVTADAGGIVFETEDLTWEASVPIGNVPEGPLPTTHVALLGKRDVWRSGRTYSTTFTYSPLQYSPSRPNNFNDFGRPHTISETGDSTRKTARTFSYGSNNDPSFGIYIVDKIGTETVQAPAGGEAFTRSYQYDAATGFKKSETIHGITMTYTPHASGSGNVGKAKDENNHETSYHYTWAVPAQIDTEEYTIMRSINVDSTMTWEKRRGFTTSFLYDALARPTRTTPPLGTPINTSYDDIGGSYVRVTRGTSDNTTTLDGFGRTFATSNAVGVKTKTTYDACGRRVFESYPYTGTSPTPPGTSFAFDPVGRLRETTQPGNDGGQTTVKYAYSQGVDLTITDEEQRTTKQDWAAFGDPGETRLTSVTDAASKTTAYTYNTLGSLKQVLPPTGPPRQWTYYSASETGGSHGQLKSETHPESGAVVYTYDLAGNLKTKTDAGGQATTLTYDGNNRLTYVDRVGTAHDTDIGYDESDNRTTVVNGDVSSDFTFDSANRLTFRTDVVNGHSLETGYLHDNNDNVTRITYPSQRKVDYAYDSANRITQVKSNTGKLYASAITYHPSGALDKFIAGNGRVTDFAYNSRYRLESLDVSNLLALDYGYDDVGNVTSVDDSRSGFDQGLIYDDLDRLKTVSGFAAGGFSYDAIGNRLSKTIGGVTTNYAYSPTTNRLTSASGGEPDTFGYEQNGNMTANLQGAYTYTPDHMLAKATITGVVTEYRYDGDNMRKRKIAGSVNRYYVHGPGGQLLGEYTDSCSGGVRSVRDYLYLGSWLLATIKDAPAVNVAATSSVAENAGTANIGVTVTTSDGCPTDTDITLAYATANGTAVAGSDYTATAGMLTIPSGTASGSGPTIRVPITNDTAIESNETFKLTISNVVGATLGTATQTVTILDNDTPVVTFTLATATVGESGIWTTSRPTGSITTGDGNALSVAATIKYATANITAKAGTDYTAQSGTLTFPAGAPSGTVQQISVDILQDALGEPDETFKITLSAPVNAALGTLKVNTVTIEDDEPFVQFTAPTSSVSEAGGWVTKPTVSVVTGDGSPLPSTLTVQYVTANVTAIAGTDYVSASGTLTFAAGSPSGTTQRVTPTILQDAVVEPNETFKITLSAPVGGLLGSPKFNTVTIVDDEPSIQFTTPISTVSEAGVWVAKPAVSVVTVDGSPLGATVTVKYTTANITAQPGSDYVTASGFLTFAAGSPSGISQQVAPTILQDAVVEPNETFKITLSVPMGGKLGSQKVNTITIEDDEPTIAFTAATATVSEAGVWQTPKPTVTVTTPKGTPLTGPVTIKYLTANITAKAGSDYTTESGTLTFAAGMPSGTSQPIVVTILQDTAAEADETFKLTLSAPTGGKLGTPKVNIVTIEDDEPAIRFVAVSSKVSETAGAAIVHVTIVNRRNEPIDADAWVSFDVLDGTATGTCTLCAGDGEDADYERSAGKVSFPAGSGSGATQEIAIPIREDDTPEADETFTLRLMEASGRLESPTDHTVTIVDDYSEADTVEIDRLPFRIRKSGRYRLAREFVLEMADGAAISIEADAVLLDLAGFGIANLGPPGSTAIGIRALNRRAITIRSGALRGFHRAIVLESEEPTASGMHRIEELQVLDSGGTALEAWGRGSRVLNNRVAQTGHSRGTAEEIVHGIAVFGPAVHVVDNDVTDTRGQAIYAAFASSAEVRGNRIGNTDPGPSVGIMMSDSNDVDIVGNRIAGTQRGIILDRFSSGRLTGNVMSGVAIPYEGTSTPGATDEGCR